MAKGFFFGALAVQKLLSPMEYRSKRINAQKL